MNQLTLIATDEPLWVRTLREQCKESSQGKVGKLIGYSKTVVSQVLSGVYIGDLKAVEKAVRGAFLGETVGCPVMGETPANICLETQRRPYAATNHQRVQLFRACRSGCPYSQLKEKK
jgi:hypothetical protein